LKILSIKNILGKVGVYRWGSYREYYFSLNLVKGRLICYKKIDSKSAATFYRLNKGKIIEENS
jgi:hypothetical protein